MISVLHPRILDANSFTSISWKRPSWPLFVVEEKIDIGVVPRLVTRRGAKQEEVLDTKLP